MLVLKGHLLFLLLAVNLTIINCSQESLEQSDKPKREALIGSFGLNSKYEEKVPKDVKDELSPPARKLKLLAKTTVEFWPPDMDKEKFFSLQHDSPMVHLWPGMMKAQEEEANNREHQLVMMDPKNKIIIKEPLPDIPVTKVKEESPSIAPAAEGTTNNIDEPALAFAGPAVFPTSEPTVRPLSESLLVVPRGSTGNRKRKLKKKVKVEPVFAEVSPPVTEYDKKYPEPTPIYENIDEPYVEVFKPIRYTDIISNLSNLTQQSFGMNATSIIDMIDNSKSVNVASENSSTAAESKSLKPVEDRLPAADLPSTNNELTPIDIMMGKLKRAIDDRNFDEIKKIVLSMDDIIGKQKEKKSRVVKVSTRVTTPIPAVDAVATLSPVKIPLKTGKVYLAPRVRVAQRKLKAAKKASEIPPEVKGTVTEIPTTKAAETVPTTVRATEKPKSTTEKVKNETAASASTSVAATVVTTKAPAPAPSSTTEKLASTNASNTEEVTSQSTSVKPQPKQRSVKQQQRPKQSSQQRPVEPQSQQQKPKQSSQQRPVEPQSQQLRSARPSQQRSVKLKTNAPRSSDIVNRRVGEKNKNIRRRPV